MGTTKILVVANAPGILQRVQDTLAGLEVHVAIRLRDAAETIKQGGFHLVVVYLGFEEQSTVELVATLAAGRSAPVPAIVCIAPAEGDRRRGELEGRMRAAGAAEYIELRDYPPTAAGNDVLRKRILTSAMRARQGTPIVRLFQRAARVAGGPARLAAHLEVPEADILRWVCGEEDPPELVLLAAFELVLTDLERGSGKPN